MKFSYLFTSSLLLLLILLLFNLASLFLRFLANDDEDEFDELLMCKFILLLLLLLLLPPPPPPPLLAFMAAVKEDCELLEFLLNADEELKLVDEILELLPVEMISIGMGVKLVPSECSSLRKPDDCD